MSVMIVAIGDELLNGQTLNTNANWMAKQLSALQITVSEMVSIADTTEAIHQTLVRGFDQAEVILCTGGLGPTKDDITKKSIASFFQVGMVFSQETHDRMRQLFAKRNIAFTEGHQAQCYMPENAVLKFNRLGTAPAMYFENAGKLLVSMPGVPYEMKAVMQDYVLADVAKRYPSQIIQKTLYTVGLGESYIEKELSDLDILKFFKMAYLPSPGSVRLRLQIDQSVAPNAEDLLARAELEIREKLGNHVLADGNPDIVSDIRAIISSKKMQLMTAESCTGGAIASKIVEQAGASSFFQASIIAYSNALKSRLLNVPAQVIADHGAVSEEVVIEMLKGGIRKTGADVGIAVSGVAGPGGGTETKPVGTVWISVGSDHKQITKKFLFGKDRAVNIEYTSAYALHLLRMYLLSN